MSAMLSTLRSGRPVARRVATILVLLLPAMFVAGCGDDAQKQARAQRTLVEAPAVGDRYAAELTYFSDAAFERQQDVFGLMKVVAVSGEDITLVTENGGSPDADDARKELAGEPAAVHYDGSERIVIARDDLVAAFDAGHVLDVRR